MKFISLLTLSFILSSCNVIQLVKGEGEIPDDFFNDYHGNRGPLCQAEQDVTSTPFHSGDGTSGNPYVICEGHQLQEMKNHLTGYFILDADLDLSSEGNFEPIGSCNGINYCYSGSVAGKPFIGSFNGQNYRISNLYISKNWESGIGLFGFVEGNGTIENLNIENASINVNNATGSHYAGIAGVIGRTGSVGSPLIRNIYFDGDVNISGGANGTGLIIGNHMAGTLRNVVVYGDSQINISATTSTYIQNIGAIAGNQYANIYQAESHATINIDGTGTGYNIYNVGGITGSMTTYNTTKTIQNVLSRTYINLDSNNTINQVGGILGKGGPSIKTSVADADIYVNNASAIYDIGGVVGNLGGGYYDSIISDLNFNTNGSITTGSVGGFVAQGSGGTYYNLYATHTNCKPGGMASCTFNESFGSLTGNSTHPVFLGAGSATPWDFANVWEVESGYYPRLRN